MKPETIKTLLKEFDYDKNSFEDTLDFLIFITNSMINIKESENKGK